MTMTQFVIGVRGTIPKGLVIEDGSVRNRRTSRDHPNSSIVDIDQNTEKSPENLRRLAVTLTTMKEHQLKLI